MRLFCCGHRLTGRVPRAAHGVYWGSYAAHAPAVLRDSLAQLAAWAAEGWLRVRVSHTAPLDAPHDAFAALLERRAIGKVLLTMEEGGPPRAKL